jgi:tetratricopeptide (TPR) repeat protein
VSARRPRRICAALLGLVVALACACGEEPASAADDDGIPVPRLDDVDPDVVAAIEAARAAVRSEPTSGEAWGRLGNRYFVHDFLPEAAACFAKAEELAPERYVWPYRRALCLIDDDPAEAALHLERCLPSLEDHAPAHEHYANVLTRLGRTDEAIAHFARASELDPGAPQPETGLGQLYLARGEMELARTHLEAALARDERHTEAHVALAQVYLELGRPEDARRHAELSRTLPQASTRDDVFGQPSLAPAGARARTKFGKQLERRGQTAEAEEQYRAALAANPDYYAARWSLATLLAKSGRKDDAVTLLREAEQRHPELEQVRTDLARLEAGKWSGPDDGD